jgi:hypothetical protein
MNKQEAIQELIAFYGYYAGELKEECEMAISAIERQLELEKLGFTDEVIENYRKFEDECIAKGFTFKSLIEAREKQIPKKPIEQRYVNNELIGICPSCQLRWDVAYWQRHCSNCGQKLDWRKKSTKINTW